MQAPLCGRVLGLHLTRPSLSVYFIFDPEKIQLTNKKPAVVHTEIYTTFLHLIRLRTSPSSSPVNTPFSIHGDVETAQRFHALWAAHHIDWEEQLSPFLGGVMAYNAVKLLKKPRDFLSRNKKKWLQDCADYVQEETHWLPSRTEAEYFYRDIDELRLQVDRLQAKIARYAV